MASWFRAFFLVGHPGGQGRVIREIMDWLDGGEVEGVEDLDSR